MVVFNFLAVIVIFPAMIVIDKNRRKSGKYDLLCCIERLEWVHISLSESDLKLSLSNCRISYGGGLSQCIMGLTTQDPYRHLSGNPYISLQILKFMNGCILFNIGPYRPI